MDIKIVIKIVLCSTLIIGQVSCQTGYFETKEAITPTQDLTSKLLKDVVITLQNNFPPAKTKLFFPHEKEKLATSLEDSLRRLGYGLTREEKDPKALILGYKLSSLDNDLFVLNLVVGPQFQLTRLYSKSRDGDYVAAGPMLIRRGL